MDEECAFCRGRQDAVSSPQLHSLGWSRIAARPSPDIAPVPRRWAAVSEPVSPASTTPISPIRPRGPCWAVGCLARARVDLCGGPFCSTVQALSATKCDRARARRAVGGATVRQLTERHAVDAVCCGARMCRGRDTTVARRWAPQPLAGRNDSTVAESWSLYARTRAMDCRLLHWSSVHAAVQHGHLNRAHARSPNA